MGMFQPGDVVIVAGHGTTAPYIEANLDRAPVATIVRELDAQPVGRPDGLPMPHYLLSTGGVMAEGYLVLKARAG